MTSWIVQEEVNHRLTLHVVWYISPTKCLPALQNYAPSTQTRKMWDGKPLATSVLSSYLPDLTSKLMDLLTINCILLSWKNRHSLLLISLALLFINSVVFSNLTCLLLYVSSFPIWPFYGCNSHLWDHHNYVWYSAVWFSEVIFQKCGIINNLLVTFDHHPNHRRFPKMQQGK